MSHYKPYPAYKDSGVEWLGQVPEHWDVTPLKYEAEFVNGAAFKPEQWSESGTPIIRIENLNGSLNFNCFDGEVDVRYHADQGDLLFGWSGNRGTSFGPFLWPHEGRHYLNQHIFRICNFKFDKSWFYWSLKAVTAHVEDQAHGIIGMVHITKGDLGSIKIATPVLAEQQAIAAHLDRETTRIDALVEKKTRFIELLREKRQALITHAVTKGLSGFPGANRNAGACDGGPQGEGRDSPSTLVKMKDSGVEWLGEVPEHWDVGVVSRVATRTVVGIAEAATHAYADSGTPILRSTNIRPYRIIGEILYVNADFADDRDTKLIHAGDLVTVRTGNAGVTAVVPPELEGCQCFTMLITTLKDGMQSDYYCYWMNSAAAIHYFSIEGWGTAQVNISVPILKSLPVPIPPELEQKEIVAFLLRETQRLDILLTKTELSIALLKERRSALITAAVTGQIDLREVV